MTDNLAWIVLLVLLASAVAMFFIAGSLPGHIAKARNHPWAQAVTVAGWVTLICGFALWPIALPMSMCRREEALLRRGRRDDRCPLQLVSRHPLPAS